MNPCDCRVSGSDRFLCNYAHDMAACLRVSFADVICPILCRIPWWDEVRIILNPPPEPEPWWEIRDLVGLLIKERLQLPNPDPELVRKNHIEALTVMRKGFEDVIEGIDRELKTLGS